MKNLISTKIPSFVGDWVADSFLPEIFAASAVGGVVFFVQWGTDLFRRRVDRGAFGFRQMLSRPKRGQSQRLTIFVASKNREDAPGEYIGVGQVLAMSYLSPALSRAYMGVRFDLETGSELGDGTQSLPRAALREPDYISLGGSPKNFTTKFWLKQDGSADRSFIWQNPDDPVRHVYWKENGDNEVRFTPNIDQATQSGDDYGYVLLRTNRVEMGRGGSGRVLICGGARTYGVAAAAYFSTQIGLSFPFEPSGGPPPDSIPAITRVARLKGRLRRWRGLPDYEAIIRVRVEANELDLASIVVEKFRILQT
jgi:hypothetical protein